MKKGKIRKHKLREQTYVKEEKAQVGSLEWGC